MVSFNSQGGSAVAAQYVVGSNMHTTPPAVPIKTGYTFDGWYKESNCINAWDFATDIVSKDTTLYAKWIPIDYTITYNLNGGSGTMFPTSYTIETPDFNLPTPTRIGQAFGGWYDNIALTGTPITSIPQGSTENKTFWAGGWRNTCFITFNSQGGSAVATLEIGYGSTFSPPQAPTRAGYTFAGWYKETECINPWNFLTNIVNQDITLYAKWVEAYTLYFDANGGIVTPPSKTVTWGEEVGYLPFPTKEDDNFMGWNTKLDGSGDFFLETTVYNGNEDITIYAQWEINPGKKIIMRFNSQGGSEVSSQRVDSGALVKEPIAPIRLGYTFDGWYREAECINDWLFAYDTVRQSITLYAKWIANTYKLTFNPNGGYVEPTSKNVVYEQPVGILPIPTLSGRTFIKWTIDGSSREITETLIYDIADNLMVYAQWNVIPDGQFMLSLSSNPADAGTIAGSGTYEQGTEVTAIATANADYEFVNWTENNVEVSRDAIYTFIINNDRSLVANFEKVIVVVSVTGIELSLDSLTLKVGEQSVTLTYTILPSNATNQNVSWISTDPSIATVVNGVVSRIDVGTTNIIITTEDGGFSDTCHVTVEGTGIYDNPIPSFAVYPSPTSGKITITAAISGGSIIEVMDLAGNVVYNMNVKSDANVRAMHATPLQIVVDLSDFTAGTYFVKLTNGKYTSIEKVVKR